MTEESPSPDSYPAMSLGQTWIKHQYDTGKAIISSLAPWLLVFLFCCCFFAIVAITGSAILGPSIQNVFDSIQSSLMP